MIRVTNEGFHFNIPYRKPIFIRCDTKYKDETLKRQEFKYVRILKAIHQIHLHFKTTCWAYDDTIILQYNGSTKTIKLGNKYNPSVIEKIEKEIEHYKKEKEIAENALKKLPKKEIEAIKYVGMHCIQP